MRTGKNSKLNSTGSWVNANKIEIETGSIRKINGSVEAYVRVLIGVRFILRYILRGSLHIPL